MAKKGFIQITIIGIAITVIVLGLKSYFYFSNRPVALKEENVQKLEEILVRENTSKLVQEGVIEVGQKPKTIVRESQPSSFNNSKIAVNDDVVQGYPVNCYPRLGFDNHRTEQTFVINPRNNKVMYVNVEYKGIYKSVDGGDTWSFSGKGLKGLPRNDDPSKPCHDLRFHLYIDPSNPDRLLAPGGSAPRRVGEGLGGLSESLDGGATWHQLFTSEMSAYTEAAIIDPINSNIVYVTTSALPQGMDGIDKGNVFVIKGVVYKTADGGKTWNELPTGFFTDMRTPGIFIDAKNSKIVRLATFGLPSGSNVGKKSTNEQWGLLETNDAGLTWTKLGSTLGIGIRYIDVSSVNMNHFFMMASKDNTDKVYYSIDGTLNEPSIMIVNFARYDPHDKTGMRLIGLNLYAEPNDIFESLDGGKTWNVVGKLPESITSDHRATNIVFDPIDTNVIYINSDLARIWRSSDKGNTWRPLLSLDKLEN